MEKKLVQASVVGRQPLFSQSSLSFSSNRFPFAFVALVTFASVRNATMSEASKTASLAAAAAAASPGLNWADDVDDELKPSSSTAKDAAAAGAGGDDDDAPPGFEHISPGGGGGGATDAADALVAKIGGVAVRFFEKERLERFSAKER